MNEKIGIVLVSLLFIPINVLAAVDNNKFKGYFEVSNGGEYKVACANYEGGLIMEKTVVVSSKNPKTSDKIVLFASLALISLVGVGYVIFNFNKQVKQK